MVEENSKVTNPARYELIDKEGKVYDKKFRSVADAAEVAKWYWPDQEQDPDRTGAGWDVQIAGASK